MTDREQVAQDRALLELAAKAAGYSINTSPGKPIWLASSGVEVKLWNPLTDDGDALRLAVRLKMDVSQDYNGDNCVGIDHWKLGLLLESNNDDPYAATRRAIVRAAAEIGKDMK